MNPPERHLAAVPTLPPELLGDPTPKARAADVIESARRAGIVPEIPMPGRNRSERATATARAKPKPAPGPYARIHSLRPWRRMAKERVHGRPLHPLSMAALGITKQWPRGKHARA